MYDNASGYFRAKYCEGRPDHRCKRIEGGLMKATYDELEQHVWERHQIVLRDVRDSDSHFGQWADKKGYTINKKDPQGKYRSSSQIWWSEYMTDPEGNDTRPPYLDFWHWLIEAFDYRLRLISHKKSQWTTTNTEHYMDVVLDESVLFQPWTPEWVQAILIKVLPDYGGRIELHMSVDR